MTRSWILAFGTAVFLAGAASGQTVVPGAGTVSTQEVDAFVRADANRDGHLDYPEFRVFVRRMAAAGQSTAITIRAFGAYRIAFRRVDANRDGLASPGELRRADDGFRAGG
ncbi:hypothetical protein [Maliponia aquimaris]|uniref:EF hand n=1 Tax=Maliponia aquimaris TaxID=1673631 RepID=A0A238L707_9RHOB|nr:hypothetical protein [Maliponia aquimaris]SMX50787.1 EF hand [Maliponia aquimaris]